MNWNLVSSTSDDETITNVFHKSHVFKLTPDSTPLQEQVALQAIVRNHRMIVSVDNNLFLLENEENIECNTICFDSPIDAMELSCSGLVVICALRNGDIHGIHIQGNQLFHISVGDGDISQIRTFVGVNQTERSDYIFMCSSGTVYRLSNVDEKELPDVTMLNGDTSSVDVSKTISLSVELTKIIEKTGETDIETFCVFPGLLGIVSSSKKYLYLQQDESKFKIKIPKSVQSFKAIYNFEHYLIGLSSTGRIFEICLLTKTIRPFDESDDLIKDIAILQVNDNEIQLLLQSESNGCHKLKIVDFPSMKCHYEIPIGSNTHLVQQSQSSVNLYYLEEVSRENIPQEIIMNLIGESDPAERLKKLIRIGRLDEAEIFASQFNLSNQPIYEARVRKLLIEISSVSKVNTNLIADKYTTLLSLVTNIKNTNFLLSLRCTEVTDKDTIQKLLHILLENVDFKNHEAELGDIKEQILRFDTLEHIDPFGVEFKWQTFVNHPNLFKLIKNLMNKNIDAACFIWKRHSSSLVSHINLDFVMTAGSLEPLQVTQWYRHFVPCIIQELPSAMSYLIDNAIEKMRYLQYLRNFPEIGITFIKDVIEIFSEVQFLFSDAKRNYDGCMARLSSVISVLEALSVLKRTYNITMMYDDYVNNTIEENAFNILLRVHLNHLKDIATDFLFPIFFEKGMLPSDTVISYVEFLVRGHKSIGFWQERAVAAIDLIYNTEKKLECILSILRVAPVPWSETITTLLKFGSSSHPLAAEIYNEYESHHLKILKIKYGWKVDSPCNILKLAFRIIKVDPEIIDDIRYLIKVDSRQNFAINSYYITTLLQQSRIEKCFEFMSLLTESEIENVLEFIINIEVDSLQDNPCIGEFYKYCKQRITNKTLLNIVASRQKLRSTFQLELTPSDLSDAEIRKNIFEIGINTIVNNLKMKESNLLETSYNDVILLSTSLNHEPMKGVVLLTKILGNIHFTCGMAKIVLQVVAVNEHNYRFFRDLAVLLIGQQIKDFEAGLIAIPNTFSYVLAYKLLQESLKHGPVIYREINELLSWSNIGCDIFSVIDIENFMNLKPEFDKNMLQDLLNETCNGDSFSLFESVCSPTSVEKPSTCNNEVLRCLSSAIHLVCTIKLEANPFERVNQYFEFNTDPHEQLIEIFTSSLDELIKKNPSIAFKIMQLILKYQKIGKVIFIRDEYVKKVNKKIIYNALQQKLPNFLDLTAVLMSDKNPKEIAQSLNAQLKNTTNYVNYLKMCETCNILQSTLRLDVPPGSIFKFQYYKELCRNEPDPSIKSQTTVDFQTFGSVLATIQNKVINVSLLKKMSEAFNWNYQEVLVTQILAILNSQDLDYTIKTDVLGKEELIFKNSVEELCDLCEIYINELTCTKNLADRLINFMKTINFYFYELFLCVINLLKLIGAMEPDMNWWRSILKFLKHKMISKRRNPMGQIESDTWLACHSNFCGVPPPISKYRLPFLLAVNKTLADILSDEINVEDLDKWFPLIQLHAEMVGGGVERTSVVKDEFCMLAVKNSMNERKNQFKEASATYNLHPINNEFLQSILRLISYMSCESNILFVLHFTSNHAPEGADQVEAAHECFNFAINNEPELMHNRRSGDIVTKIKRQYPIYKTKYLLHLYNLRDDKLFQLVESPEELISQLYEHESILKDRKIDINKLAEEMADLHRKNLKEIQLNVLKTWFCDTSKSADFANETFFGDLDTSMDVDPQNLDIMTRACYILNWWSPDDAILFCLSYIDQASPGKKLLAFECYMKLSSDDKEILPSSQFIAVKCDYYLKQLGFKSSDRSLKNINELNNSQKIDMLKEIWRFYATDSNALEVIILISIGYDIYIPKLWNSVLKQMVALKMMSRLSAIIQLISRRKELRQIDDGFVLAWEYLIKEPFESALKTRSTEQETRLAKSLFLCQTCPVVSKIDLVDIGRQFVYLERCHMAAALLSFCNEEQKTQIIEMIKKNAPKLLKDELLSLTEFGIYSFVIDLAVEELEL